MTPPFGHLFIAQYADCPPDELERFTELAKSELSATAHARRLEAWALSRWCLWKALLAAEVDVSPQQLALKDFTVLDAAPEWRVSLSHSRSGAGAWIARDSEAHGIGLDLEPFGRGVPPDVSRRVSHAGDASLAPLVLWGVKEAAYKSLGVSRQDGVALGSVQVLADGKGSVAGQAFTWRASMTPGQHAVIAWF